MQKQNDSTQLITLDALIARVEQFNDLSPSEKTKVIKSILLWLSIDRQKIVASEPTDTSAPESQLKQILAWCQSDDYAYKDWN